MAAMLDTLAADAHHSLDIKHSRFLAHAAALDTPAHALEIVQRVSVPDATHNCWAYRFGQDYRSSDDGEPSGTAGRPILAAIDGQG
ncbi:YigZ family protein, partial [Xanthomonas vasicola]